MPETGNMKQRLMQTAIALWKEKGYDNVSIPVICEKCGVTKGSFYHHFESKDDLLLAYYKTTADTSSAKLFQDMIIEPSYINKLWLLFQHYNQISLALGPDLSQRLITADLTHNGQLISVGGRLFEGEGSEMSSLHISICRQGQAAGEIRSDYSAEKLMEIAESACIGLGQLWSSVQNLDIGAWCHDMLVILLKKSNE